jgi:hypothetical protein
MDEKPLMEGLLKRSIQVRTEVSMIPLKGDQVRSPPARHVPPLLLQAHTHGPNLWYRFPRTQPKDNRDAVCKALYSRLFDWLVTYINKSIVPKEKAVSFIGVLDIFGFELFKVRVLPDHVHARALSSSSRKRRSREGAWPLIPLPWCG